MSDVLAAQAREEHRAAAEDERAAARHREQRDRLIRGLRDEDPRRWTHVALARAVGCSPELIAHVLRQPRGEGEFRRRPA